MSIETDALELAVTAAMAAVHEALDSMLHPDDKADALDEIAERATFDAAGQRKLDERRREQGGT